MAKWTKSTLFSRLGDELVELGYINTKDELYLNSVATVLADVSLAEVVEQIKGDIVRESMTRRLH